MLQVLQADISKKKLKDERQCLTRITNTKKNIEIVQWSILMNLEVFGDMLKHCLQCLIYSCTLSIKTKTKEKTEK